MEARIIHPAGILPLTLEVKRLLQASKLTWIPWKRLPLSLLIRDGGPGRLVTSLFFTLVNETSAYFHQCTNGLVLQFQHTLNYTVHSIT